MAIRGLGRFTDLTQTAHETTNRSRYDKFVLVRSHHERVKQGSAGHYDNLFVTMNYQRVWSPGSSGATVNAERAGVWALGWIAGGCYVLAGSK